MGVDRLSLHRHGKEALDEAAGGTVDVGVPAAGEPDRPLHVGQVDGETVEPGQPRVAGEAAHPVRDVGGVGVQAQGLVQEARAGPGGTDSGRTRPACPCPGCTIRGPSVALGALLPSYRIVTPPLAVGSLKFRPSRRHAVSDWEP